MSELLPTLQADDVREGLVDFLSTTFALADEEARDSLNGFLRHPERGIFKGPYVRLRLPFRPAEDGWRETLEWYEGHTPYGHQAAAFARLSSANLGPSKPRPLPTLVTTGTGSGKTEAFLHPILDHVLRAKRAGEGGTKALILYPMNALANDQARRLSDLITEHPALGGIRAAIYTGQDGPKRKKVTAEGLITHRESMRENAPDILLTNYKMLDQLLLRPADQTLWKQSATSLRYLVLDEFHSYDGAQGTDVAMLLRRLGLALKRHWPKGSDAETAGIDGAALTHPLGLITPIATSATLGDKGDPTVMVSFANTVFGGGFDDQSVVTETRVSLDEWAGDSAAEIAADRVHANNIDRELIETLNSAVAQLGEAQRDAREFTNVVFGTLYSEDGSAVAASAEPYFERADAKVLLRAAKAHPFVRELVRHTADAVSIDALAATLFGAGLGVSESVTARDAARTTFLHNVIAALSHVRAETGLSAASVDLHLWVRALSRIDRLAGPNVKYHWSDDGPLESEEATDTKGPAFPAIYCRHCGRSGWGVQLGPVGNDLDHSDSDIRRDHANGSDRFRALIFAPREADQNEQRIEKRQPPVEGLAWFDVEQRSLSLDAPASVDGASPSTVLPVLVLTGSEIGEESKNDRCPNCQQAQGIRFLGSAVATLLSVSITSIFGDRHLDDGEKKALVFTDSVQDAAHRAGFVQSRSHVFTLRNAIRKAIGSGSATLDDIVEGLMNQAGDDAFRRYRLLAPDIVDRPNFRPYWDAAADASARTKARQRVRTRLQYDVAMEFGLQSRVGRTLELTGSVAAGVDAGPSNRLEALGRAAIDGFETIVALDDASGGTVPTATLVRWVRGALERMRERGAIEHKWFQKYIENDGARWSVSGGRPRGEGMPAFPPGRESPGYPRVGAALTEPTKKGKFQSSLDHASSAQSWYSRWASRVLDVSPSDGAKLTRLLFAELVRGDIIASVPVGASGATAFQLRPDRILVQPVTLADRLAKRTLMECDTCQTPYPGTTAIVDQLVDGPCLAIRCTGTLRRAESKDKNYYRDMYDDGDIRRVVAREHTSLLDTKIRLAYEDGFKKSTAEPDAPNVLVATPTLEMGIDIGDLSTVFLAGLPRSVASYMQRVGRAGRLTGNSLSMAFVVGRGEQLPKLGEPLSVINGEVRPPATYLDAEEILQRQYLASIVDQLASGGAFADVKKARDVLANSEGTSFLGTVIEDAEQNAKLRLDAFLGTFTHLSNWAIEALRNWALPRPGIEPRKSGVASVLIGASQRWNQEESTFSIRRKTIADSLDGLEKASKHPAASDDEKLAYRAAKASYALVTRQLKDLRNDPWVSALERFGVLPNYTLLDDSVRLDVALSWVDPDSQEFKHEGISYERGAGIAISELAPGAKFYAQGVEIEIDAVDLGADGAAVGTWVLCPDCGYARDAANLAAAALNAACPRCGSKAIADAKQKFKVVELEQVSAEVRRDEASINDRADERQRERFTVQVAADIKPESVVRQWFVDGPDSSIGVKYLRDLTIRWFNFGKQSGVGTDYTAAGDTMKAPLFRVCDACGKLDQKGNTNSFREHRAWCRHRASRDENTIQLVLSRTLVTQGIVLRMPPAVAIGDGLALPSVAAAVQLGLRELIGGDPDHLRIAVIQEPVLSDGGENHTALLLHDAVPGGTGYLADLAEPDRIRDVLMKAWIVLATCECRNEGRAACHRCLLPYAPGQNIDSVSRASAERLLREMLGIDEDGVGAPWVVTKVDPGAANPESQLEQWFRQVFKDRAAALGATIAEKPGSGGNTINLTFPSGKYKWELRPQVLVNGTQPDFVLRSITGGVPPIAIYLDGQAYHASPDHNRVRDDAEKRRMLRESDYIVWAITWADVKRARENAPEPSASWFSREAAATLANAFGLAPATLDHVTSNPVTQLMEWLQNPADAHDRWRRIAHSLGALTILPESTLGAPAADAEALIKRASDLINNLEVAPPVQPPAWHLARNHFVMASRNRDGGEGSESVVILDDRPDAVASPLFADAWRLWLKISNLFGAAEAHKRATIMTLTELDDLASVVKIGPTDAALKPALSVKWNSALEDAEGSERDLLLELSLVADMVVPEIGIELGDGIPVSMAWSGAHVAVAPDADETELSSLANEGWNMVEADVDAVCEALGLSR